MIVLSDSPTVEAGIKGLKKADYRLFKELDQLVEALESFPEEPCVIFDKKTESGILPLIHLIKKLRADMPLYVLSEREENVAFLSEMLRAKIDGLHFYRDEDEIVPLLEKIGQGSQQNFAKNVAFVGSGTGATFCLVNTAVIMKTLYPGLKIGIVDCDYYKEDVLLRFNPESRKPLTLNDLLIESIEEQRGSFESLLTFNQIADLMVIPSGGQNYYFSNALGREDEYLKLLTTISMQNDVTFFNIGSGLTDLSVSALRLADKTCQFVTQEPIPIQVMLNLSAILKELNHSKELDLVLNRYRKENKTITAEMIESVFGRRVSIKIPEVPAIALASELERRPVDLGNGGGLAQALKELAHRIVIDLALPKEVI